jgi:hypothetical protein
MSSHIKINTRHNQIVAHPDVSKVHVAVAIPYMTHNDHGFAKAYLNPEDAKALAQALLEAADEVCGTDAYGHPRRVVAEGASS